MPPRPRPTDVVVVFLQGTLNLVGVGLFVVGQLAQAQGVWIAGAIIIIALQLVEVFVGLLSPSGVGGLILIGAIGTLLFSPWWLVFVWPFAVVQLIYTPSNIWRVVSPRSFWQRRVFPQLSGRQKMDRWHYDTSSRYK